MFKGSDAQNVPNAFQFLFLFSFFSRDAELLQTREEVLAFLARSPILEALSVRFIYLPSFIGVGFRLEDERV